jgi:putative hydrolase of the HAD superfamily
VVIWDVDGTLVRRIRSDVEVAAQALARWHVDVSTIDPHALEAAQSQYREMSRLWRTVQEERDGYADLAVRLLEAAGRKVTVDPVEIDEGLRTAFGAYELVPAIVDVLQALEKVGVRQAVVSNWTPSLPDFLRSLGLERFFAFVVASGPEGLSKPDPRLLLRALGRLGASPAEAIVVGDDPINDLLPAERLECATLHFDPAIRYPAAIHSVPELQDRLAALLSGDSGARASTGPRTGRRTRK